MCPEGSCSPWRTHAGADSWQELQLWREAHTGAGFLEGPVAHGGPSLEQSIPEGLYPMERTHIRAVLEELQTAGRTHVEVHEGLPPMGGSPCWSRGKA